MGDALWESGDSGCFASVLLSSHHCMRREVRVVFAHSMQSLG